MSIISDALKKAEKQRDLRPPAYTPDPPPASKPPQPDAGPKPRHAAFKTAVIFLFLAAAAGILFLLSRGVIDPLSAQRAALPRLEEKSVPADPDAKPSAVISKPQETDGSRSRLEGIIRGAKDGDYALIDGEIARVGTSLEGWLVSEILEDRVTLTQSGTNARKTIRLKQEVGSS